MDVQLITNEENHDGAQRRENQASGMISFVSRTKNNVGNAAAEQRSDDAEDHCPQEAQVYVHYRFRNEPSE